ncbi:Piso0_001033 [Millerozyma farinosa CBS 7064]|uniref:Piso0_001033 protein n=1 Tax=Pichia sorbitophila (strain ATCC MYA-4447 / BCRC 22081 / CBS 7064 / NBRC 10061 / NRRL Y-12695) TaxID=559304 RepID=G8YS73_PICSO|nr:Piso0_001033 [Millerozyma farinosa CBS 7064]CCE78996.1 Piso0_001033 [Millerozyma farinosa CBS 7064]
MGRVSEMEGCRKILRCCGPLSAAAERCRGARMGCCPRGEESALSEKLPLVVKRRACLWDHSASVRQHFWSTEGNLDYRELRKGLVETYGDICNRR